jgi:hypothetical protein
MSRPKSQFSEGDLRRVREFIEQALLSNRRVFRKDVFDGLTGQLEATFTELAFTNLLGETIKAGTLPYRMVKGKFGGIIPAISEPEERADVEGTIGDSPEPPPEDITSLIDRVSQQLPSVPKVPDGWAYARRVWIGKQLFLVHRPYTEVHKFLTRVLQGAVSPNGPVVFNGIAYSCERPDILARFLTEWSKAISLGECEPILQGDSDVPVDLR